MKEFEPKLESPFVALANELDQLQSKENDGRGISCVKAIVAHLRLGDVEAARTVSLTDGDKIRNYPDIEEVIQKKLLA